MTMQIGWFLMTCCNRILAYWENTNLLVVVMCVDISCEIKSVASHKSMEVE